MRLAPPTIAPRTRRRILRWTGVGVAVVLAALIFAVTTARTEQSLGPHIAQYQMTTTDRVVIDLGPLGTIQIDSPLPANLGINARVEEIPEDVMSVGQAQTLEALGGDLTAYLQFFSGPQATISDVGSGLVQNAILRFAIAVAVIGAAGTLGYVGLGAVRRRELSERLDPVRGRLTVGLVLVLVVGTVATSGTNRPRADAGQVATAVFDGTALEGARMTGRLAGVIDTYGGMLVRTYEENQTFYADTADNLSQAWESRLAKEEALMLRTPLGFRAETPEQDPTPILPTVPGGRSLDDLDDPGEPGASGDPGGSDAQGDQEVQSNLAEHPNAAPEGGQAGVGQPEEGQPDVGPESSGEDQAEPVTLLMVSDLHCNIGMTEVIKRAALLSGADMILNGGDTTINGSTVEKFCITSFAGAAPDGVPFVSVTGNHDSVTTAKDMADAGMHVLSGGVIEIDGVRILGDADPNETRLGSGTQAVGTATFEQVGLRLAETACEDSKGVDLLLIHTPYVGSAALGSGCVPVQLSGHLHRRIGPLPSGLGTRYVSGTTAGAAEGELTVGPLRGTAEMTVLRFDPVRRIMLDFRVITLSTAGEAEVGDAIRFPRSTAIDMADPESRDAVRQAWLEQHRDAG